MPEKPEIERAHLIELKYEKTGKDKEEELKPKEDGEKVPVQFNPETLTVDYQNQSSGGDQQGKSGKQHVGRGNTSMSVELLFDITHPTGDQELKDVRQKTKDVYQFLQAKAEGAGEGKPVPPPVRFSWGSFLFDGEINSMSETLEFFDAKGHPLRASVSISMSRDEVSFTDPDLGNEEDESESQGDEETAGGGAGGEADPETRPPGAENVSGTPVQKIAGAGGKQGNWKDIAAANDIENPRSVHNAEAVDLGASV